MSLNEITVYTLFLVLFILVLTAMVFFSEYMDKQRKDELAKREKIENEFNDVLFSVFDTIEDFSQVTEDDELSSDYVTALMAKKLGLLLKYEEEKCDQLFSFAIVIGVNNDFSLDYDENQKASLLKDYSKIKYKLNIGQSLLKRTRIKIKCEGMVRSRYESWFVSENFKKIKSEDDSIDNQIVLLCEMYVILRDKQSYKKALPHIKAIKEITDTFNHFFDESLLNTFLENHVEFEVIYERTRSV
jgi:response regulator RpfG family c-di-GMP phosphodiesterase